MPSKSLIMSRHAIELLLQALDPAEVANSKARRWMEQSQEIQVSRVRLGKSSGWDRAKEPC